MIIKTKDLTDEEKELFDYFGLVDLPVADIDGVPAEVLKQALIKELKNLRAIVEGDKSK